MIGFVDCCDLRKEELKMILRLLLEEIETFGRTGFAKFKTPVLER